MAVSGKCYLSLNELNASANRGACMQVCRRAYIVKDKESDIELEVDNQYIMSPKDLKDHPLYGRNDRSGRAGVQNRGTCPRPEYVEDGCRVAIRKPSGRTWTARLPKRRKTHGTNA